MFSGESNDFETIATRVRCLLLKTIFHAGSGHPSGALSIVEILIALYFERMNFNVNAPESRERDRFVLSKGHACAALYAVLVLRGIIDISELRTFRQVNSRLQGHPHCITPWIDASTGSLGQGFSAALGIALGMCYMKSTACVYVLLGDGELQEGMVWEGALFAAHNGLSNVCAIVDCNRLQSDALVSQVMNLEPLKSKWASFGWNVIECNGHQFEDIYRAFELFAVEPRRPSVIIAHTIKGRGVAFMEGEPSWHGALTINRSNFETALIELNVSSEDVKNYIAPDFWG